jgi:hypothetical protein
MTTNAKKELLNIISKLNLIIKCAYIPQDNGYMFDEEKAPLPIILKENYSEKDYDKFLNQLNFKYDSGYGGQELYGTVWLTDNSWLQRGEYDGSEWWEHMRLPTIPNECK